MNNFSGDRALAMALIFVLAAVCLYDVFAITENPPRPTVSDTIRRWSSSWPFLPLSIGLVMGHLFW